jgi:hypothetical protein
MRMSSSRAGRCKGLCFLPWLLPAVVEADLHPGSRGFRTAIAGVPADARGRLKRLADWADSLEREGLAELATFHGKEVTSLLSTSRRRG